MRVRGPLVLVALALASACASAGNQPGSARTAPGACAKAVGSSDYDSWFQVDASGFSMCLPDSYKVVGPHEARVGINVVRWGRGRPSLGLVSGPDHTGGGLEQWREAIGGEETDLTTYQAADGAYVLIAFWPQSEIYVVATSADRGGQLEQLHAVHFVHIGP